MNITKNVIQNKLKKNSLIITFFCLYLSNCQQQICKNVVRQQSCKICYYNIPKSNSTFISCQSVPNNSIPYDNKHIYTQPACLQKCCGSTQYYFSIEQLSVCQQQIKNKLVIILSSIFGGLAVIFLIFCCCFCRQSCSNCCKCLFFTSNVNNNIESQRVGYTQRPMISNDNMYNNPIQIIDNNGNKIKYKTNKITQSKTYKIQQHQQWKYDIYNSELKVNKNYHCPICLGYTIDCMTQCRHTFHYVCLEQWMKRNKCCPVCRDKDVTFVRYYCTRCYNRYRLIKYKSQHLNMNQIEKQDKYCKQCAG